MYSNKQICSNFVPQFLTKHFWMRHFVLNRKGFTVIFLIFILFSCINRDKGLLRSDDGTRDLAQILAEGKLVAITDYNSTNYFLYKGEPMGYQFEMLYSLASFLGVKLEMVAENDLEKSFKMLRKSEGDIIASNLTVTKERKKYFNFTIPHSQTRQVLVQRKVADEKGMPSGKLIRNPLELDKKVVYVQKNSSYATRLKHLSEEIGGAINVVEMEKYEAEQLVQLVSSGEIEYTVCDENIARVQAALYQNIDVETAVGFPQNLAWAVRKTSPDLQHKVDEWLARFVQSADYRIIKNKYFNNPTLTRMMKSDYFYVHDGKLSDYDEQLKVISNELNWDWRLLASMIYQESRFQHDVESRSGAYGLMQFMPTTAERFGIEHKASADIQLEAGVKYLKLLEERMKDNRIPEKERIKFILAAYNAGIGHVLDARNLARKYGKNPNVWDNNVEFYIQNKSDFSGDSVVRFGSLKGKETYRYVSDILERYQHYKNIVKQ